MSDEKKNVLTGKNNLYYIFLNKPPVQYHSPAVNIITFSSPILILFISLTVLYRLWRGLL